MADISKIKLPDNTVYDIKDKHPVVKDIPNTPTAIATFNDGSNLPLSNLKVGIEPVQDLHDYDYPWVGGAGKNKYPILIGADGFTDNAGATHTNDNGVLVISASDTNNSGCYSSSNSTIKTFVSSFTGAVTYSFDIKASDNINVLIGYESRGAKQVAVTTSWQRVSITTEVNADNPAFIIYNRSLETRTIQIKNFMFEVGSTAHDYEPYSNICPISGWSACNVVRTGKNLVNWKWNTFNDGKMEIFLKGGTYTLSAESTLTNGNAYIRGTKPNGEYVSREELGLTDWGAPSTSGVYYGGGGQQTYTFSVPNCGAKIEFGKLNNNGTISAQLEFGSSASDFEPYNGNTYIINFVDSSSPLTVYGGYIDWENNCLVITHRIFELTKTNTGLGMWQIGSTGHYRIRFYTTGAKSYGTSEVFNGVCNFYKPVTSNRTYSRNTGIAIQSNNVGYIYDPTWDYQTALDDFKTWLDSNPITLTYELATHITIPLQLPQIKSLKGVNNLYANTGDVLDGKYVVQDYSDITSKVSEFAQLATIASKLGSSNVGSATQPIYLSGGTATACTYTLGKSVPSDAVFTDTDHTYNLTSTDGSLEITSGSSGNNTIWDASVVKVNGHTVNKDVPSTAVFTDANVTQTELESSDTNSYEVLLASPGTATQTTGTSKSQWLTYKPLDYELIVGDESNDLYTKIAYHGVTVQTAANSYLEIGSTNIRNSATWDGTNEYLKEALAAKLPLSGGTMTGIITMPSGKWYTAGNYALHLDNSDIIGVNGLWFNDLSSDGGEGIMFPRNNGNWDDLYSVDGTLYYCVNRTTAGSRGSAYTVLHTGNGVLKTAGTYTGGNKTAGYCMHGVGTGHTYACEWGSNLGFWVDLTKVATVSDRRLKDDIKPINMNLVNAIAECESYQYKAFNRGGNISVGIIAQDLVANCEKYGVDPLEYELIDMEEFIEGDPTLYYHIEYDQLLYFKTIYLENKVKELEAKLDSLT